MQTIYYPIFDDIRKLKVSLLYEKTSEVGKNILLDATSLEWRYAVTNVGVKILIYIPIFILLKEGVYVTIVHTAFCLFLYLTGVHFRGELQHGGGVSE